VVPDIAESTTTFFSEVLIKLATSFILEAEPTDVPPNFNTSIVLYLIEITKLHKVTNLRI